MNLNTTMQTVAKGKLTRRFWLLVAFHALLLLGIWQGDYHETLLNGTAL